MNFTRHTYRIAIARSIRKEAELRANWERSTPGRESINAHAEWLAQINHTARLQRRKRKERK